MLQHISADKRTVCGEWKRLGGILTGDETIIVDNSFIVNEIEVFLSKEFECYGYKKKAKQLNRLGYIINGKKVRRLMSENDLMNHSYNRRRPVKRVVQSVVDVSSRVRCGNST